MRTRDMDIAFVNRCVHAWGIQQIFDDLVSFVTPEPIAAHIEHAVLDDVKQVARMVFGGATHLSFELIGSVSRGTNILKADGEQSDRDYSFSSGRSITQEEWQAFSDRLAAALPQFREVVKGSKAVQFRHAACLRLRWELVPAKGHFTFDMVEFPTFFGTGSRSEWEAMLRSFYAAHPCARKATKVLKRLLPELRGYILEGLVYSQGQKRLRRGEIDDPSGMLIYEEVLSMLHVYPHNERISALRMLMQDAQQWPTHVALLEDSIASAKGTVVHIYSALPRGVRSCDACLPLRVLKALMWIIGCMAALILFFVFVLVLNALPFISRQEAFGAAQPWKTQECRDESCFCVDCFGGQDSRRSLSDYDCELWGLAINRCTLARRINIFSIVAFGMVAWAAYSVFPSVHAREHACTPMLWFVLSTSMLHVGIYMTVFDVPLLKNLLRHPLTEWLFFVIMDVGRLGVSVLVMFSAAPISQYSHVLGKSLWSSFVPSHFFLTVMVYFAGHYICRLAENDLARQQYLCFTFGLVLNSAITACGQWHSSARIRCCVRYLTLTHLARAASNTAYFALRARYGHWYMSKYVLIVKLAERSCNICTLVVIVRFVRLIRLSAVRVEPVV